jgi:hypothetical protein
MKKLKGEDEGQDTQHVTFMPIVPELCKAGDMKK